MKYSKLRYAKKVIISVVGFTILFVGFALLFLPGPGIVVIFFGLVVLAVEFVWAKRLLERLKNEAGKVKSKLVG